MSAVRWKVPERIGRLDELANNLWWSWHPRGRQMFRALDYVLWRVGGHNPVRQLREISPDRLQRVAVNAEFLELYDSVMAEFDADVTRRIKLTVAILGTKVTVPTLDGKTMSLKVPAGTRNGTKLCACRSMDYRA